MRMLQMTKWALAALWVAGALPVFSQQYALEPGEKSTRKIRFELINNLVVVPLEVNGATLSFILDTGVSKPILFNLSDQDSLELRNVSKISIRGLGEGPPMEGLRSAGNTFRMDRMVNPGQELYVVLDREMNFTPSLGFPVHGIIGYDLFRDFVVEINYDRKFLRFHNPGAYRHKARKGEARLPLEMEQNKAFLKAFVVVKGQQEVPVKLLMDSGSSDALWLFPNPGQGLEVPEKHYEEFLGKGLGGIIYGKRTRIDQVRIGDFVFRDAKAAFPDMESFWQASDLGDRNGSLGGDVLRRFNMVVNYPEGELTLIPNAYFDTPFQFNLAGIELEHAGVRYIARRISDSAGFIRNDANTFGNVQIMIGNQTKLSLVPEIVVSAIRLGSPAEEVGLREGDVVLAVNGKPVHGYKLQEVLQMINDRKGKRIRLLIERYNRDLVFSFVLRELFE